MPLDFPLNGARTAIWLVAQLHLFFAAFVLGAPIFIVVAEWLGLRTGDPRYERLAQETMKVVAIAYSLTAIFGVLFAFVLMGPYQPITNYLFKALYPRVGRYFDFLDARWLAMTEQNLSQMMALAHVPDPDLVIRTGGEQRISNFLLWQSAYSEFFFSDTLWPDFDEVALDLAIQSYAKRERRYGKVSGQVDGASTPNESN